MTPKQVARVNQVKLAAEQLKLAKKEARNTAKIEARAFYNRLYTQLKAEAVTAYYIALSETVDSNHQKQLDTLMIGLEDAEMDEDET